MTKLACGPGGALRSRVVGEGSNLSPEGPARSPSGPVGLRCQDFAEALYDLCDTLTYVGAFTAYEADLTVDIKCDITEELNERVARLLNTVGKTYPWHSDVDVVFEAVHAAVAKALPGLRGARGVAERSSGSP